MNPLTEAKSIFALQKLDKAARDLMTVSKETLSPIIMRAANNFSRRRISRPAKKLFQDYFSIGAT